MNFLFGFLGGFLGIIIAIIAIITIVLHKALGKNGTRQFINMAKSAKVNERINYSQRKSVSGMTKILEPSILTDFPDFNKNVLFNKIEENLNLIFDAIERKDIDNIKDNSDFELLQNSIREYIEDIKQKNIDISYSNVKFHQHAIKSYETKDGMATITTSSSLGYLYKNSSEEHSNEYSKIIKETRYTCTFVYIYDIDKIKTDYQVFTINCPNCGAPLKGLKTSECEYCSSHIEPVNLKTWKMSSYKEDF